MSEASSSSESRYRASLDQTGQWLLASVAKGKGGSCAHYSPLLGWSNPYPETTGYLVPTLLKLANYLDQPAYVAAAQRVGDWLLSIQNADGSWCGGLHPNKKPDGSVFNTGQILKGMTALYRHANEERYLAAALAGARWLANGVNDDGLWPAGDYQANETPSYYTHVTWPMLEVWQASGDEAIKAAAIAVLENFLQRRTDNGVFRRWGFGNSGPAFTHTIAYTIRGFQESASLLDDYERYGAPVEQALDTLLRIAELKGGALSGAFDEMMKPTASYVCLTGNAQIAICLLLREQREPDLRLVNGAAKLLDYVCAVQRGRWFPPGMRGVAGSHPLWGGYMIMRYPNGAAKYHCDALMRLLHRLQQES